MNRTLLLARIAIAILLLLGIFAVVVMLLLIHPTMSAGVKSVFLTAIGQLLILLGFTIHSLFNKNAEAESPSVPTQPPQAATQSGAKNA